LCRTARRILREQNTWRQRHRKQMSVCGFEGRTETARHSHKCPLVHLTSRPKQTTGRYLLCSARRRQKFSFGGGGHSPEVWVTEVPQCGPQGQSPGKGSEGRSLPEAEALCRHCLQILIAETIKFWKISQNSPPDCWPVCFTVGGKRHFGGLALPPPPPAHAWRHWFCSL